MTMLRILASLAVTALLIQLSMAVNHTVGGTNGGWDTSNTGLQAWASAQSFMTGDNLIFQFTPNHDVLEVSQADHDSCSTSNSVQTYTSSPAVIPLSSPGKRFFICGTAGHCGQGMKIEVDTLASSSPTPASPPTSPPASPVTPPASSPPPETSLSPKSAPTMAPTSPSPTPMSSPAPSPNVSSAERPTSSPPPAPSSAHEGNFQARFIMGFGSMITMLLAL